MCAGSEVEMGSDGQKGPGGRPSKLNEDTAKAACNAARMGAPKAGCCRAAGVAQGTVSNWLEKDDDGNPKNPEFFVAFKRARWEGEKKRLSGESQHDRFILATSFGYTKSEKKEIDHTSSDGSMAPAVFYPSDSRKKDNDGSD